MASLRSLYSIMSNYDILARITLEDFTSPPADTTWQIRFADDNTLPARLTGSAPLQLPSHFNRDAFKLTFRTEQTNEYYHQAIHTLIHPSLGEIPLLMVPIGPDPEGFQQYEITIS